MEYMFNLFKQKYSDIATDFSVVKNEYSVSFIGNYTNDYLIKYFPKHDISTLHVVNKRYVDTLNYHKTIINENI